jgi:hypothetical protein
MWTRSFVGFLKSAQPGDVICFTPELLGADVFYARKFRNSAGEMVEESDRWEQALMLGKVGEECWQASLRRSS